MTKPASIKLIVAGLISLAISCGGDNRTIINDANTRADASPIDASPIDASPIDASPIDASLPPDAMPPPDAGVYEEPSYDFLSETGLYVDINNKVIANNIVEFIPEFQLWSDDAEKIRWIQLPPGTTIDTSDMDNWKFPLGTKVWKQFGYRQGANLILIETRLTEFWGPNPGDLYQGSFVWNAGDTDAAYARFGATNVKGTDLDVPAADQCVRCHRGQASKVLGFQAVQLSHTGANNLDDFEALGWFTTSPTPGGYPVPGNPVERAALGYLHANCGGCHSNANASVASSACYSLPLLQLRVQTTDQMVEDTFAYQLAVDQDLQYWVSPTQGNEGGYSKRIVPADPTNSAIYYRMSAREAGQAPPFDKSQQMPPIFTDVVDTNGLAALEAWILSL